MLTINPARAVHADDQIGSLEEGKKADILVIREVEEGQRTYPVITATLVDGRVVSRMWYPALPSMSARFGHRCRDDRRDRRPRAGSRGGYGWIGGQVGRFNRTFQPDACPLLAIEDLSKGFTRIPPTVACAAVSISR